MADMIAGRQGWEKSASTTKSRTNTRRIFSMFGFVVFGVLAMAVLGATLAGGRFFITVDEVVNNTSYVGKSVKVSGAVIGETISFDPATQTIRFTVAHVTDKTDEIAKAGGIAEVLHQAVINPSVTRMPVVVRDEAMPDLLRNEAQAILIGRMGEDGVFYADSLQLKCPSKYESEVPDQAAR
jgi:cytochrome c-type biogenesis protein CcmE